MIALVYDVGKYRRLLGEHVKRGDLVVEIGPHVGKSTLSYVSKTKLTVAVDKAEQSSRVFRKMLKDNKNLRFVKGDARSFGTVRRVLDLTSKCDVLALDMGGGRYPDTVFKVWAVWSGVLKPRDSLIRDRGLGEFVKRVQLKDDYFEIKFPDAGWLASWGRATPYKLRKQLGEFKYWVNVKQGIRD